MTGKRDHLSLYQLLDPEVLANPYPLYHRLRTEDPVHWDPYLHAWVATSYDAVVSILTHFSAVRTPTPERLEALNMARLSPIAKVMVQQMLFLDPPQHTRVRALAAAAFAPRRVDRMRAHIAEIADGLLGRVAGEGGMDVIADFANQLPAIVTAEMLGVPSADHPQLKAWSESFAEMLGNFQHNPERAGRLLADLQEMLDYFRAAIRRRSVVAGDGLISTMATTEVAGERLTEDEAVANLVLTMVGGQETTTNLIGNGLLTLLRHESALAELRADMSLVPSAAEELLRYESPSQHTARLAREDVELGGKLIRRGQAAIAVMGAANRDPGQFPEPDVLDLQRSDNRHLAFGWSAHFCFGARLARIEGQEAFSALLNRFPEIRLASEEVTWRPNLGLRGLNSLPVKFGR